MAENGGAMRGKTVLVTGANTGIGFETAKALACKGARVVLACRNADLGQTALHAIQAACPAASLRLLSLDLASLQSIHDFAHCFVASETRLDVLINNAGLYSLLKRTPHSRVIVVSSEAHRFTAFDCDNLNFDRSYAWPIRVYGASKLANLLFAKELHRRYFDKFGIAVYAVHPGVVRTKITNAFSSWQTWMLNVAAVFGAVVSPEMGAATSVYLACLGDDEASSASGKYFCKCQVIAETAQARDPQLSRRLWTRSETLLNNKLAALRLPLLPSVQQF